jgi:DNA ligase (NAD+)
MQQVNELVSKLTEANNHYRNGTPIFSDDEYDAMLEQLRSTDPENPYLKSIEPEGDEIVGKLVDLPERMLSTNKAYSISEIEKWSNDVLAVMKKHGYGESDPLFRVTPKLDGFAAYNEAGKLYTRGNGRQGTDISRALDRGLRSPSGRLGLGKGEIVVAKEWFERELSGKYENSRNIIASVIKEGDIDGDIQTAINAGAICFHPFAELDGWYRNRADLIKDLEAIWTSVEKWTFDTDGLVIETVCEEVKEEMGSTNHHHRWQIAYKKNTEFHDIRVNGLQWQTAKTGRITPVVLLEPTQVSGVTISKATGHHAGNVISQGIDKGAVVKVCRSGQVIPYIQSVVTPVKEVTPPTACPSCGSDVEMQGDNLVCTNEVDCPAQIERTLEYFFKTIGNCDGFGPKVIEQICKQGYGPISGIYGMDQRDFEACGISAGIASNLCESLTNSQRVQIEDWRFLAAFSIPLVGRGGCEKLLSKHKIADVFDLTVDEIVKIDGFAEKTAKALVTSLAKIKSQVTYLLPKFNIKETTGGAITSSPIAGMTIVFTGSMQLGGRSDMEKQAKSLGAKVSSSVSSKTTLLVCGENVGASKTDAAKKHGVRMLSESEYLELIEQ